MLCYIHKLGGLKRKIKWNIKTRYKNDKKYMMQFQSM